VWSAVTWYLVALRGERKKSGGEVGERPMISNKRAGGVAVTTLVSVADVGRNVWYKCLAQNTPNNTMGISLFVRRRPVATCLLLFTFVTTIFAAKDGSSEKNSGSETTNSGATELKTEVLYTPDECSTKSKNGDMLTMHYKGTLQDGTTFDSRYDNVFSNENIMT